MSSASSDLKRFILKSKANITIYHERPQQKKIIPDISFDTNKSYVIFAKELSNCIKNKIIR